jgi:predicted DNA binding CopG/RHH family protein
MKIPKFKNEAEEADWLYTHRKEIERELRTRKPLTDKNGKPMTVAAIVAAHIAKQKKETQAISIRLPIADIERAKKRADAKGVGYQTLIRMLLHEALEKAG